MPTVQLKHSFGEATLMEPGGAPKCPQGVAPISKSIEMRQVWCLSLRIDAYYSAETFFWRTDPHGARGNPQKAPQMGPHPTSTEIHLCMVSIDSSRCVLSIYNILLDNRASCPPTEHQRAPQMGPHRSGPIAHPCLFFLLFVNLHNTFF